MRPHDHRYDTEMMSRALRLARRGAGFVSPNPMVGAVVVEDGKVIAEGYHHQVGQDHAEVDALKKIDFKAKGCDMYVSLEPCNHEGRTPPCTSAIIRSGVRTVHVAMVDPNPLVAGTGIERLRQAGIQVEVGLLEQRARQLNEVFLTYISTKRPFVHAKAAISLDGKIATRTGDSGQHSGGISGEAAHRYVQTLRKNLDAILVGAGTVLADNPRLTYRGAGRARQPLRIVLDGEGLTDPGARIYDVGLAPTLVATTRTSRTDWRKNLQARGVDVLVFAAKKGFLDIGDLLDDLGREQVSSVLVEGGSGVLEQFVSHNAVDRFDIILAPMLIGGQSIPMIGGVGVEKVTQAYRMQQMSFRKLGSDILVTAYPQKGAR